jgi:hypothetical protein
MNENRLREIIIDMLEKEKWYPSIRPTNMELKTSELLNNIITDIQERLKEITFE